MGEEQCKLVTFFLNLIPCSDHRKSLETRAHIGTEHTQHPDFDFQVPSPEKEPGTRLHGGVSDLKSVAMKVQYEPRTHIVFKNGELITICTLVIKLEVT